MQGRTIPPHHKIRPYSRVDVKEDTRLESKMALEPDAQDNLEARIEDTDIEIAKMHEAYSHSKEGDYRPEYKIIITNAIQKFGYKAVWDRYK
jgi:hypothetical protein